MPNPDKTDLPAETFGQALERIAEGGLLRLVVSKPIQQAIGRLIWGATDVPVAYLERWSQAVRSDTIAQKQITSAVATAARAIAAGDPQLANRWRISWRAYSPAKYASQVACPGEPCKCPLSLTKKSLAHSVPLGRICWIPLGCIFH